jgi:hypothetical protein
MLLYQSPRERRNPQRATTKWISPPSSGPTKMEAKKTCAMSLAISAIICNRAGVTFIYGDRSKRSRGVKSLVMAREAKVARRWLTTRDSVLRWLKGSSEHLLM